MSNDKSLKKLNYIDLFFFFYYFAFVRVGVVYLDSIECPGNIRKHPNN